ncbi:ras family small GTPase [Naegleria gruberi]|uniref:Ras family small GTPase n=1 Tax=Naegleria gruberi TaxID=5762 RepID=D2VF36_NAEGR|nr:ras family small GTPase [Naegleria gruberi]EFC44708.1 ras family small GTPase [Naegleria gruberi]|eukprot:XP_002677452.1 ras family small GTPase [Naegleria gruberi strain NEG-M]
MPKNDKGEECFTFAVCGGGGVGKSSITIRWTQDTFIEIYDPTIENTFDIARKVDNKTTYLTIVDTAGQDEFSALQDVYMRTAFGFVLVFDCTSHQSLEELQKYTERISRIKMDVNKPVDGKECPIIIIGNKVDMLKENPKLKGITEKETKEFMKTHLLLPENTPLFFASAKTTENLKECFESIVREMRDFERGQQPKTNPFEDEKKKRRNSGGGGLFSSISASNSKETDLKNVQDII